ncbi:hypothetical protein T07_11422, partial [Trichinella nelsoni]
LICNTIEMKAVFIIATAAFFFCYEIQGKLQKVMEPLPCEDRGGDVTCKKLQKSLTFLDECLSNRRTGRYLCCRTCAKGLGVEITEEGKFKDKGNFTFYEPECPILRDRESEKFCEKYQNRSLTYNCHQSEAQAACPKTCNLRCGRSDLV